MTIPPPPRCDAVVVRGAWRSASMLARRASMEDGHEPIPFCFVCPESTDQVSHQMGHVLDFRSVFCCSSMLGPFFAFSPSATVHAVNGCSKEEKRLSPPHQPQASLVRPGRRVARLPHTHAYTHTTNDSQSLASRVVGRRTGAEPSVGRYHGYYWM